MVTDSLLKELMDDDEKWIKALLSIETKSGQMVPFVPTPIQHRYLEWRKDGMSRGRRRRVILKPRQVLVSTIVLAKNFKKATTIPGTKVLTITHHDDATNLFRLRIRQWSDQLKMFGMFPETDVDNVGLLSFKNLNSLMVFQTAGGKLGGRAAAYNTVHLSEVDFWPGDPQKTLGGILPSVPEDGEVDMESTAQSADGLLHDYYTDAKNGDNEWEYMFWRWWDNPDYVRPVDIGAKAYTLEEQVLKAQHGLSDEQMSWRRWMIGEMRRTASKA